MKKSLVLAMAMALGVTASAYAANPFSDVPAGHWAYDSIDKLAAAGVIDGMGDGTYQGDKTMTRYEMAQIVAKAMAKGANVDKLAAEFADELDNLGVRVANLEKKADNVQISGLFRATYWGYKDTQRKCTNYRTRERSEINLTGQVNENWSYNATIRNEQYQHHERRNNGQKDYDFRGKGEEGDVRFLNAYVSGRLGGVKVQAGHMNETWEDGWIATDAVDGIAVSYGKKIKVSGGYGQWTPTGSLAASGTTPNGDNKYAYARVDGKVGVIAGHVAAYKINADPDIDENNALYAAGINTPIVKNLTLDVTAVKSENECQSGDKALIAGLSYKGANRNKVGSYGIYTRYFNQAGTTNVYQLAGHNGMIGGNKDLEGASIGWADGFKGIMVGASYVPAKRVQATLEYWDLKGKTGNGKAKTIFSQVEFRF